MSHRTLWTYGLMFSLAVAFGCDGGGSGQPGEDGADGADAADAGGGGEAQTPDLAGGGTIKGQIAFEGTPPPRVAMDVKGTAYCAKHHGDNPPLDDTVIVNPNGTLRNVAISISEGLSGRWVVPSESVLLDQVGCMYVPHVVSMQARQELVVKNSDDTAHNIHFLPEKNREINRSQPKKDLTMSIKDFRQPEKIFVKCDVHAWMGAYVCVYPHPFHAVTRDDGTFEIKGVPAGTYTLEAWHEKFGTKTQEVEVKAGEAAEVNFSFSAS